MDSNQKSKKGWLTSKLEDKNFRRLYERELVAESFITRIVTEMDARKITKSELAKRMDCSLANISRALRSTTNMTIATMVDMALALDLRIKDIELEVLSAKEAQVPSSETEEVSLWGASSALYKAGLCYQEGLLSFARKDKDADDPSSSEAPEGGASLSRMLWLSGESLSESEVPSFLA